MAFIVESCIYGYFTDPPHIAVWEWETYILLTETKETSNILIGNVIGGSKIYIPGVISGFLVPSCYDDIYGKIHIKPYKIAVGQLIKTQVVIVIVWNATPYNQTLNNIEMAQGEGISISANTPDNFIPYTDKLYEITISLEGPPIINEILSFIFTSGTLICRITGTRFIIFKWVPTRKITEILEFKTDILKTWKGEQRICLRRAPRQIIKYSFYKDPITFSGLKTTIRKQAHRYLGIPIWHEASIIKNVSAGTALIYLNTNHATYETGGNVFIWESDFKNEALGIANVYSDRIELSTPTSYNWERALIMPLKSGIMSQGLQITRYGHDTVFCNASFIIINDIDYGNYNNYEIYDGYPVLDDANIVIGSISEITRRPIQMIDNDQGLIIIETIGENIYNQRTLGKVAQGKGEIWAWKQWLYYVKGRLKVFWLPTYNKDIVLKKPIKSNETGAYIENVGLSQYGIFPVATRLKMKDGRVFYKKIVTATKVSEGEIVAFDSSFETDIDPSDILLWCFMDLVRLDADSIELNYNGEVMKCQIPVKEVIQ